MGQRRTVTVQQGIWIDRDQLAEAGLEDSLEVVVGSGEIRIKAAPGETKDVCHETAWDVFLSLGREAQRGRLRRPAERHNEYLYGSPE